MPLSAGVKLKCCHTDCDADPKRKAKYFERRNGQQILCMGKTNTVHSVIAVRENPSWSTTCMALQEK